MVKHGFPSNSETVVSVVFGTKQRSLLHSSREHGASWAAQQGGCLFHNSTAKSVPSVCGHGAVCIAVIRAGGACGCKKCPTPKDGRVDDVSRASQSADRTLSSRVR